MGCSSGHSFSFQNQICERRQKLEFPAISHKKPRKNTLKKAVLCVKTFDLPLISRSTGQICESICLEPYKPYTIGRKYQFCDFVITDRRISKRHCQLLFDSLNNRIYLSDGVFVESSEYNGSFCSNRNRGSLNGVSLNGIRISGVVALQVGDEVRLVCGKEGGPCWHGNGIGFIVERIVSIEEVDYRRSNELNSCPVHSELATCRLQHCRAIDKTRLLLSWCKDILGSDDPISYIRKCIVLDQNRFGFAFLDGSNKCYELSPNNGFDRQLHIGRGKRKRVYSRETGAVSKGWNLHRDKIIDVLEVSSEFECANFINNANSETTRTPNYGGIHLENGIFKIDGPGLSSRELVITQCKEVLENDAHANITRKPDNGGIHLEDGGIFKCDGSANLPSGKLDIPQCKEVLEDNDYGGCILPPGKKFYLNRLQSEGQYQEEVDDVVSLPELFHPIKNLVRVFIATFTSDILWFISYCKIPPHLPVTIACHSTEKCWSLDPDERISVPYSDFPNLTVVYPPFPETIAFNKDRKNSGIACHHPKLMVLQREDSMRVVITSANLVAKQWHDVTNTVWWQDFPRLIIPENMSLFTQLSIGEVNIDRKGDFAAQLAGFVASLVVDIPSQAYWILELIKYDFKGAVGYLVASVPGIHSHIRPRVSRSKHLMMGKSCKTDSGGAKLLTSVEAAVVGLSYIYHASADSNGARLRKLASFLSKCDVNLDGMSQIVLQRDTNIPADRNAVSVFIPNPEDSSLGDIIQLGFLPRNIAKWVAPLSDNDLFAFSAYINPKEALSTVLEGADNKVKLILYVYAVWLRSSSWDGPSFTDMPDKILPEYASAICSLIALSQRFTGLWRLKEVLGQYKWPEHLESDLVFGSSSVGAINARFLAAFSAAAGKRSVPFSDSDESDPDWGSWNTSQEIINPSVRIIFPTIERVKNNRSGIAASRRMLCFSEVTCLLQKTWQRLKKVGILHDATPFPTDRVGFPMHVKVGRKRFEANDRSSFGWVYCGSHNFSAAAWGRPISDRQSNGVVANTCVLGSRLHVSNYELGIVFIVPPPDSVARDKESAECLDDIILPFMVPPPKYSLIDKPATAQAMRDAWAKQCLRERELYEAVSTSAEDCMVEEIPEEEDDEILEIDKFDTQEKEEEKTYAGTLWSQVHSSRSQ
ncbi:hypothetical protein F511_14949 [Dorcoceras hygrometricum]|uniref:FHA domain-containing protein n=1 Tax=Dorcoceras hygrometricum TaxID=472368 RepID=A0A2Z7AQ10_9LAMI|nr:hypothetical protein F511_14949 [Dorcoceras hygrometricum]